MAVEKNHLENVEVILGVPDGPKLPAGTLDGVLMVIAYHGVADYEKMLEHVKAALREDGRLVIVDMAPHETLTRPRADQTKNHGVDTARSADRARHRHVIEAIAGSDIGHPGAFLQPEAADDLGDLEIVLALGVGRLRRLRARGRRGQQARA